MTLINNKYKLRLRSTELSLYFCKLVNRAFSDALKTTILISIKFVDYQTNVQNIVDMIIVVMR